MFTIKDRVKILLKDIFIRRLAKIFFIILLLFLIIIIWKWPLLPPEIPLFYSLPRSIDQLGPSISLLLIPLLSIIFFSINFLIASYLYTKEQLASILLVVTGTVATILLFITFIKIIFLIT